MARQSTGQVVEYDTKRGTGFALRFRALGKRQYVTLGAEADGWTRRKADDELVYVTAQVRRGEWRPDEPAPVVAAPVDQTFHEFASAWFEGLEAEGLRPNTLLDYRWQLTDHLLPFFRRHRLSEITIAEVDRYRQAKVREAESRRAELARWHERCDALKDGGPRPPRPRRPLSATSINKTITRLGQILEVAVERDLMARNPVRVNSRKRKIKQPKFRRSYLDDADQIVALLRAAGELDADARADRRHIPRRTLLACLLFTGLRIDELLSLRWRHVDLAHGRLTIGEAKTDAGRRFVTIQPVLRDELATHKAGSAYSAPSDYVFASKRGGKLSDDNVRNRVVTRSVERANERLEEDGLAPLPDGLTPHSMRHTFISALFALGWDLPSVMAEVGHVDPSVTLGIYAHVMRRDEDARARLRALLEGAPLISGAAASTHHTSGPSRSRSR